MNFSSAADCRAAAAAADADSAFMTHHQGLLHKRLLIRAWTRLDKSSASIAHQGLVDCTVQDFVAVVLLLMLLAAWRPPLTGAAADAAGRVVPSLTTNACLS